MNRCSTCGEWAFASVKHRCPPAFVCVPVDDFADTSGQRTVYAYFVEDAATKFAETWDCDSEYPLMRGNTLRLRITAPDGAVALLDVTGESVPAYHARQVLAPPEQPA
jgi:hypothetical protein